MEKVIMNFIKSFVLLQIIMFCDQGVSQAQTITQDEFLNQLQQVHPLFEKEKITSQIEKMAQSSYLGAQDWNLFSSASFSHEEPAIAFAGPEKYNTFSINSGLDKTFWSTGGRWVVCILIIDLRATKLHGASVKENTEIL